MKLPRRLTVSLSLAIAEAPTGLSPVILLPIPDKFVDAVKFGGLVFNCVYALLDKSTILVYTLLDKSVNEHVL